MLCTSTLLALDGYTDLVLVLATERSVFGASDQLNDQVIGAFIAR